MSKRETFHNGQNAVARDGAGKIAMRAREPPSLYSSYVPFVIRTYDRRRSLSLQKEAPPLGYPPGALLKGPRC